MKTAISRLGTSDLQNEDSMSRDTQYHTQIESAHVNLRPRDSNDPE